MKKMIVAVIIVATLGVLGYFYLNKKDSLKDDNSKNNDNINDKQNSNTSSKKILVAYYSATGSTKRVAEEITQNLDADIFEIEPVDVYTSADLNWSDSNSRVSKEHNDESLRDIPLKNATVSNFEDYDTVLIGYPIWWGIAAWPVDNFVKNNDFTGKTVIPFCTSSSSGIGESGELLEKMTKGGNWLSGRRFSSGVESVDIKNWTDSLN